MKRDIGFILLVAVVTAAGCRPKRGRVPPLCAFEAATSEELQERTLPPDAWLTITSPSIDRSTLARRGDLRDSCGRLLVDLVAEPSFECDAGPFGTSRVPGDAVETTDLVMSPAGDDELLLWAATEELQTGESLGPAALAVWTDEGLEIHATGPLRGYRHGARMRLHHIGPHPVLILESDRCDRDRRCVPIVQFVPVIGRRFRELPLHRSDARCIGRAQFDLTRETEVELDARWTRRFSLTRSVELDGSGITLVDLVTIEDYDASAPDLPPRPFRKTVSRRPLHVEEGRLVIRDDDLWERTLADRGSAHPHDTVEAQADASTPTPVH